MHFLKAEWKRRIYNNFSLEKKLRFKIAHKLCIQAKEDLKYERIDNW